MKRVLKIILTILMLCNGIQSVYAQENEDMSKWSFKILLQHSDQLDELKVVKYRNKENGRYGFCLEPEVDYSPIDHQYEKRKYENEEVYEICRAFDLLGDDYYIAAQLMIWERMTGTRYSFDGKDAEDYGEKEMLSAIERLEDETTVEEMIIYAEKGGNEALHLENLSETEIIHSDVTVLEKTQDEIRFVYDCEEKDCSIVLKCNPYKTEGSYIYHSDESQDIYSLETDFAMQKEIIIHIMEEPENKQFFSFYFRKTDRKGKPISGALFKVFELKEEGEELLFIQERERIDFSDLFSSIESIEVSERYGKYLQGTSFLSDEKGLFRYTVKTDSQAHSGIAFVCDDQDLTKGKISLIYGTEECEVHSSESEINTIANLETEKKYLLCETVPKKGYTFASNPCVLASSGNTKEDAAEFVNAKRRFDLKLYKENEERNILLNGARFRISYEEKEKKKELIYVTGALNIQKDEEGSFVLYRHENEDTIHVGKFENDVYIRENAEIGKYDYCITDNPNINDSSLLNRKTEVTDGSFRICDIPYFSEITVTELEAPKGYFIEEASFKINPDISYSQITFNNFRMNKAVIIPEKTHKIPKTCIEN